jgi:hypothetical protein
MYEATHALSSEQRRLLRDVQVCRTAALGGHLYACDQHDCGFELPLYNSCLNRHCPNCQALAQAKWIQARTERLLPIGHYHVVFTLPGQLRPLARRQPKLVFGALFSAVRETLTLLAREALGVRLGVTAVLHTWTRELLFHPHVHCVVTAGGLSLDGERWIDRPGYLFPVARMKAVFRSRLLAVLQRERAASRLTLPTDGAQPDGAGWTKLLCSLPPKKKWVVYIEAPFKRSTHVLSYLGRYTHRIAISNQRLISIGEHDVTFRTREDDTRTLPHDVFIGRFLQHVLPRGFHKIRHFGLYAPSGVRGPLRRAQELLGDGDRDVVDEPNDDELPETWAEMLARITGDDPLVCPRCQIGRLREVLIGEPRSRGPPGSPP